MEPSWLWAQTKSFKITLQVNPNNNPMSMEVQGSSYHTFNTQSKACGACKTSSKNGGARKERMLVYYKLNTILHLTK